MIITVTLTLTLTLHLALARALALALALTLTLGEGRSLSPSAAARVLSGVRAAPPLIGHARERTSFWAGVGWLQQHSQHDAARGSSARRVRPPCRGDRLHPSASCRIPARGVHTQRRECSTLKTSATVKKSCQHSIVDVCVSSERVFGVNICRRDLDVRDA